MLVVLHGLEIFVNFISNKNQGDLITILLSHMIIGFQAQKFT